MGVLVFLKMLLNENVGGGYIVIGVRDKTWEPIGLPSRLLLDTKLVRDKVRRGTGLEVEVDIVQHELIADGNTKLFALILVRTTKKRSKLRVPSLTKINFRQNEKWESDKAIYLLGSVIQLSV